MPSLTPIKLSQGERTLVFFGRASLSEVWEQMLLAPQTHWTTHPERTPSISQAVFADVMQTTVSELFAQPLLPHIFWSPESSAESLLKPLLPTCHLFSPISHPLALEMWSQESLRLVPAFRRSALDSFLAIWTTEYVAWKDITFDGGLTISHAT